MFVGAFIYADAVTLLAPTSMPLKAMLNTCTDLAASYNLLFNASKLNVCILMILAHSCRSRPVEDVDCTEGLGVSVTSTIGERTVNSSVQKFYFRVDGILYNFKDIASHCFNLERR